MPNPSRDQLDRAARDLWQAQLQLGEAPSPAGVNRCAEELVALTGAAAAEARDAAIRTYAEAAGAACRARFDLGASSEHVVFVVDQASGRRIGLSIVDVMRLLGPRLAAA